MFCNVVYILPLASCLASLIQIIKLNANYYSCVKSIGLIMDLHTWPYRYCGLVRQPPSLCMQSINRSARISVSSIEIRPNCCHGACSFLPTATQISQRTVIRKHGRKRSHSSPSAGEGCAPCDCSRAGCTVPPPCIGSQGSGNASQDGGCGS